MLIVATPAHPIGQLNSRLSTGTDAENYGLYRRAPFSAAPVSSVTFSNISGSWSGDLHPPQRSNRSGNQPVAMSPRAPLYSALALALAFAFGASTSTSSSSAKLFVATPAKRPGAQNDNRVSKTRGEKRSASRHRTRHVRCICRRIRCRTTAAAARGRRSPHQHGARHGRAVHAPA